MHRRWLVCVDVSRYDGAPMAKKKDKDKGFPRNGMEYNDRFKMTVKEFGREILIELNRGKAKVSDDGKTVTIKYKDSPTRKADGRTSEEPTTDL